MTNLLTDNTGGSSDAHAVTPGRQTSVHFDLTETVMVCPPMSAVRRGAEVAAPAVAQVGGDGSYQNLKFWSSGAWTLRPLQQEITNITEYQEGQVYILGPGNFSLLQLQGATAIVAILAETVPTWAQALTLAGMGYSVNIATVGAYYMQPSYPAGTSLDPSLVSGNAGLTTYRPQVALPAVDVPVDRAGVSNDDYPTNQGYFLSFFAPGAPTDHPRYIWSFGFGQYEVVFGGDGQAQLWEFCADYNGLHRWACRDGWRYADPGQVMGVKHTMAIFPHLGPRGEKFIAFANNQLDIAVTLSTVDRTDSRASSPNEHIYHVSSIVRGTDQDESPGNVTKEAPVTFDIRRGLRLQFQISLLAWQQAGTLVDTPIPNVGTMAPNPVQPTLSVDCVLSDTVSLTPHLLDAATATDFIPGQTTQPYVSFDFTGDGTDTPILYGYTFRQGAEMADVAPGGFMASPRHVSIQGYSGDPQDESASINILDVANQCPRLRTRGRLSCEVVTTFLDPLGDTQEVSLFRGYATRPNSTWRGVSTGAAFPAYDWREFDLHVSGMWMRLAQRVSGPFMRQYGLDDPDTHPGLQPDPLTGSYPPWKVTDVIRETISNCGFPDWQINVPDLPYRLWPGHAGKVDDQVVNPATNYGDFLMRLCRNYLGSYLYFEPNAGVDGQWGILFGTQAAEDGTYTPVYNFVTTPPAGVIPHIPGAYPSNTTFIIGQPYFWQVPPNFNMVVVSTDQAFTSAASRLQQTAVAHNFLSYQVPGSPITPDFDGPDFLPEGCVPLYIFDPALQGVADQYGTAEQNTWNNLVWTCRRLYDFLCHGQALARFKAPLVFIYDTQIQSWRPLRFQDPVSIDGVNIWLIKSIRPDYNLDNQQWCEYEVIAPRPGQYFLGFDGMAHERAAHQKIALSIMGGSTQSNLYGNLGVAPHREQSLMEAPLYTPTQGNIQNPNTGKFYSLLGYNAFDGTDG